MSSKRRDDRDHVSDYDLLDEPLVRYGGTDAYLELEDGEKIDLNALSDPFTGEERPSGLMGGLESPEDEERRVASQKQIGRRLQVLRDDAGLAQREVAERAGISVRRLSEIEQGKVELGLRVVSAIVHAIGGNLRDIARRDAREVSNKKLEKTAVEAGAPRELVRRIRELLPPYAFADALARGFAWERADLLAGNPITAPLDVAPAFKLTAQGSATATPMLALARRLSKLVSGLEINEYRGLPADPRELRAEVLASAPGATDITLEVLLEWAWGAGIVVLPLRGSGEFYAAVWFVDNIPVIVVTDPRTIAAYWLFDLAHELGHLARGHVPAGGLVDVDKIEESQISDQDEADANDYALRLLLSDPESLLAEVRRRTGPVATLTFKDAVRDVAREAGIMAGPLGLVAAREMHDVPRDRDRWGSASNLASDEDPDGVTRVRVELARRITPEELDELDGVLLRAASLPD